jgi:hypothetical protein
MHSRMTLASCSEHRCRTVRLAAITQRIHTGVEAYTSNGGLAWPSSDLDDEYERTARIRLAAAKVRYPPDHAGDSAT